MGVLKIILGLFLITISIVIFNNSSNDFLALLSSLIFLVSGLKFLIDGFMHKPTG